MRTFFYSILVIISISFFLLTLFCCRSARDRQQISFTSTDSIYVERLIPIVLPEDSATLKALLSCTEHGEILVNNLQMLNAKNTIMSFKLDSLGQLTAKTVFKHDTVYVKGDSIRVNTVITKFQYVDKPLSRWEKWKQEMGGIFTGVIGLGIVGLIVFVIKKII